MKNLIMMMTFLSAGILHIHEKYELNSEDGLTNPDNDDVIT